MRKVFILISITIFLISISSVLANQDNVCPHGNGWFKVEDEEFDPIDADAEYCWKGGSENSNCQGYLYYSTNPNDYPPEGEHVCGLSHYSYKLITPPSPNPTATPSATPAPTTTPSATPSPTPMPGPKPVPTPSPTPAPTPSSEPTVTPEDCYFTKGGLKICK